MLARLLSLDGTHQDLAPNVVQVIAMSKGIRLELHVENTHQECAGGVSVKRSDKRMALLIKGDPGCGLVLVP